jgi:protein-S-isoprenylcysteine O-methyltransferase Ste14
LTDHLLTIAEKVGEAGSPDCAPAGDSRPSDPSVACRDLEPSSAPESPWYFYYRSRLIILFAAFLVLWPWSRLPLDALAGATGGLLVLLGVALRVWCIRQIGGAARKTRHAKAVRLVTWGPFGMMRNPIYAANLLLFSGFAVLAGLPWILPAFIGLLLVQYTLIIRYEEGFLREKFGDAYDAYCRSTARWIPRPRWRRAPAGFLPYPLRRILKRERSLLLQVLGGLALVGLRVFLLFRTG